MSIINLFFIRRYPKDTECMVEQLLKANPAVAEEYIDIINVDDDTTSNKNGDETHISKSENIINIARSTTTAREAVKRDPQFPNNNTSSFLSRILTVVLISLMLYYRQEELRPTLCRWMLPTNFA